MDHEMELEVFRAGDYGPRGVFTGEDLEAMARDYSPERHEAPVTTDHRQEGPALGWVRSLRRMGSLLLARIGGLDPAFLEGLRAGAFKKRSVEIYRRAEWSGRPYLRSLSFLGACPPAVKGLADPIFAESDPAAWFAFDEAAQSAEPDPATNPMPDDAVRRFCEDLRASGRLLPAWERRGLERFLAALDDAAPVVFAEGGEPQTARGWFEEFLRGLDPSIPMGESAPGMAGGAGQALPFAEDPRVRVDPESLGLHRRAICYMESVPGCTYAQALGAVVGRP